MFAAVFGNLQMSQAAQVILEWDPISAAELAGYKVYYGTGSRNYPNVADAGKNTTCTIAGLQQGLTYYFAVTAYDTSRLESGYSNEVSATIPSACTYSISPDSQSFSSAGGSATVSVTAPQGCAWTASSGVPWVTITTGKSGAGNGTVGLSVAPSTGVLRAAGISIAGKTFTINQAAVSQTSYTITASAGSGGSISPSGTVSVNTGASQAFSMRANFGYRISSVLVDGKSVGAVSNYTFTNVNAGHTIQATFRRRW